MAHGAFWLRHWDLDAKIAKLQLILPGIARRDPDCSDKDMLSFRMQLQTLTVGLYKAATLKAETFNLDESISRQCASRIASAAEDIVQLMHDVTPAAYRSVSFHNLRDVHTNSYTSGHVFIHSVYIWQLMVFHKA